MHPHAAAFPAAARSFGSAFASASICSVRRSRSARSSASSASRSSRRSRSTFRWAALTRFALVARQMDHAGEGALLLARYSHPMPDAGRKAADKLEEWLVGRAS